MSNKLDQLKAMTDVVADTGDIEAIAKFTPLDATTNPSLLLKAAALPAYAAFLPTSRQWAREQGGSEAKQLSNACDYLSVLVGCEILKIVPGRVSTEVDARLSFNQAATIEKARSLIKLYEGHGIGRERILIKMASTWEGIRAGEVLEREGINCNLTLLFNFTQAATCAEAGITLISPFVGRILDWYKASTGQDSYLANQDPGVLSVSQIYNFYKQQGYDTIVMGASFRNIGEIEQLAGCDRLTISPNLMAELEADNTLLARVLSPENNGEPIERPDVSEPAFRWAMNEDAMASEKLGEGIRAFAADQRKLEAILKES
ncbi:MAG: transaldolase [Pseudomonadales bacterium]